jgi:glycosyltransferase involved in cell wall biosynthesis
VQPFTLVIPFFNGHTTIERLLRSVPDHLPVIIVDDQSDEPLQLNDTTVVQIPEKGFFSGAVNYGAAQCQGDFLILNQDVWFEDEGWLRLIEQCQGQYDTFGHGVIGHPAWPKGYVQGTFMYIARKAWDQVGGFNVKDYPLWGSTCEWQLRACRQGFTAMPFREVEGMMHRKTHVRRGGIGGSIRTALLRWPHRRREFLRTPPAISVVVPCFNYGRFLDDAVNSMIGGPTCIGRWAPQTFQSFEIIIVDDASTDEATRQKVRSMADPWKGIRIEMLTQNRGTPGAINAGVRIAYGDYIHILSADDMRESWGLEKLYRAAVLNPDHLIYGDIQSFGTEGRKKILPLADYDFNKLLYRNMVPAGILYPKEAWEVAGGYPERMKFGREDWAFAVACGVKGYCGHKVTGLSGNLCRRDGQNRSLRTQGGKWRETFVSQMMSLFPIIYEGERPMGCCGGRRARPRRVPQAPIGDAAMQNLPGKAGFRLLEYVGGNIGSGTFYGPETGTRYTFGANDTDRVKYVDERDAPKMLDMTKGRQAIFSSFNAPEPDPVQVEQQEVERVNPEQVANATPAALRLAIKEGIESMLYEVTGTGSGGKITVQDVRALVS